MQIELTVFEALTNAGVAPERAKAVGESLVSAIDDRYRQHNGVLVTRADLNATEAKVCTQLDALRADIHKALAEQTWKLAGIVVAGMGLVVAAFKHF